jgi:hypothetical protein
MVYNTISGNTGNAPFNVSKIEEVSRKGTPIFGKLQLLQSYGFDTSKSRKEGSLLLQHRLCTPPFGGQGWWFSGVNTQIPVIPLADMDFRQNIIRCECTKKTAGNEFIGERDACGGSCGVTLQPADEEVSDLHPS